MGVSLPLAIFLSRRSNLEVLQHCLPLAYGNQFLFTKSKKLVLSLFIFRKEKLNLKAAHSHVVSCPPRAGGDSVYLFIEDIRWKWYNHISQIGRDQSGLLSNWMRPLSNWYRPRWNPVELIELGLIQFDRTPAWLLSIWHGPSWGSVNFTGAQLGLILFDMSLSLSLSIWLPAHYCSLLSICFRIRFFV